MREEFSNDAAKTPNIYFLSISTPKNDFRGSVAPCLDIELQVVMEED